MAESADFASVQRKKNLFYTRISHHTGVGTSCTRTNEDAGSSRRVLTDAEVSLKKSFSTFVHKHSGTEPECESVESLA